MGIVDGNCRVEIYIHFLELTRNRSEKCNFRSLARIEPAALRLSQIIFIYTRKYMHAETLALLTKPLYFPNTKYLK
jgi:hypothetical protein